MPAESPNPTAQRVFAVLWHRPEEAVPAELAAALQGRGIGWEEAAGPLEAFSRILARRGSDPARVLLLVEPGSLGDPTRLLGALERFDPAVGCWAYAEDQTPRLAPFHQPAKPSGPEIVIRPPSKQSDSNGLRLVGEHPDSDAQAEPEPADGSESSEEPQSPRSVLTPEELEMLLADDRD